MAARSEGDVMNCDGCPFLANQLTLTSILFFWWGFMVTGVWPLALSELK